MSANSALESRRRRWIENGVGELDLWLFHVRNRIREARLMLNQGVRNPVAEAEIVFGTCVIINRLAQIDLRRADHLKEDSELIAWLQSASGWPKHVAKAFWKAIRNPTMHLGYAWGLADHKILVGQGEAPLRASMTLTEEKPRAKISGVGWYQVDSAGLGGDGPLSEPTRDIFFDIDGVLETVARIRATVEDRLRTATAEELDDLRLLNRKVPFVFRSSDFAVPDEA